ncbi:MAG: FAD-dependent monooxygenase [Cyanobacteria bacterium QS_8_64_29]|nr:MAG: FAD-dependent monooxygenase [Cyanobacteria bacterium QS_8_64_29]
MDAPYDVAIIGAGPVGLATAIGLRERGITNLTVLEQARAFRKAGQIVDLLPNGLKALHYLSPQAYRAVRNRRLQGPSAQRWLRKDPSGGDIDAFSLDDAAWEQAYGTGWAPLYWYVLQQALRDCLPPDTIRLDRRCIDVTEEPTSECVRVDCLSRLGEMPNPYAHWESGTAADRTTSDSAQLGTPVPPVRARLVLAADGINSMARRALYRATPYQAYACPEYSGFAAIGCLDAGEVPADLSAELDRRYNLDGNVLALAHPQATATPTQSKTAHLFAFRRPNGHLGFMLHAPLPLASVQASNGEGAIALATEALARAEFPKLVQRLVQLAPPGELIKRPYYIHSARQADSGTEPPWQWGRIALLGDAAHGMPPFLA